MKSKEFEEKCRKLGVNPDINNRWEKGIDHHPESQRLMEDLMEVDWELCNDHFCWKKGGDGDNGEALMYELDIIFEMRDAEAKLKIERI